MSASDSTPGAKRLISRAIWSLGLQNLVFRVREILIAAKGERRRLDDEGMPIPPPHLRVQVCGTADVGWFLTSGRTVVAEFDDELSQTGEGFGGAGKILDVGSGCGRLARWVLKRNPHINGADINARLVKWTRRNLPGEWTLCQLQQPLPYANATFDLAYACSVITHLREETARAWLADVTRVLRSGGRLLLTFHDEHHANAGPVRTELRSGYAVRFDSLEGSNHLAAFVTLDKLRELMPRDMELLRYAPSDQTACLHAIAIWRKR
jgi:SAM-dependent methyltransferase